MRFYNIIDDQQRYCGFKAISYEQPRPTDVHEQARTDTISAKFYLDQLRSMMATKRVGEFPDLSDRVKEQ